MSNKKKRAMNAAVGIGAGVFAAVAVALAIAIGVGGAGDGQAVYLDAAPAIIETTDH